MQSIYWYLIMIWSYRFMFPSLFARGLRRVLWILYTRDQASAVEYAPATNDLYGTRKCPKVSFVVVVVVGKWKTFGIFGIICVMWKVSVYWIALAGRHRALSWIFDGAKCDHERREDHAHRTNPLQPAGRHPSRQNAAHGRYFSRTHLISSHLCSCSCFFWA